MTISEHLLALQQELDAGSTPERDAKVIEITQSLAGDELGLLVLWGAVQRYEDPLLARSLTFNLAKAPKTILQTLSAQAILVGFLNLKGLRDRPTLLNLLS